MVIFEAFCVACLGMVVSLVLELIVHRVCS